MFTDIEDFLKELISLQHELLSGYRIDIVYKRIDKISLRIPIISTLFIDIYANTDTKRYDFSLIKDNKRIFGYDNLGGWHYHPLNKPDNHIKCKKPSLRHILKEITVAINSLEKDST
ncbi:MAG: hypothetical protein HY578_09725 [Nitrospinae bacterium]|nr:hypothetical protein [Nitrospinota bacterium]